MPDADPQREIERFLYHEARLLDAGRFDEWLELFAADGVYWVPSRPGQTNARDVASIVYEDRALLEMRIRRLTHPRAHALVPMPRTTHLVSNVEVSEADAPGDYRTESAFLMTELRDDGKRLYSGRYQHWLRRTGNGFKIALKRVDLIDCDGIHGAIVMLF